MVKLTSALLVLASFVVAGFASPIEQRDGGGATTDVTNTNISGLDSYVPTVGNSVLRDFTGTLERRDLGQAITDLGRIKDEVTGLDTRISNIGNSLTLMQAWDIKNNVARLQTDLDQGTKDVKDVHSVSEADANHILSLVKGFEPVILHLLRNIIDKKNAFLHLPINAVPVIHQALISLFGSSSNFGNALINAAPADLKGQATAIKNDIDGAFKQAIAAYA